MDFVIVWRIVMLCSLLDAFLDLTKISYYPFVTLLAHSSSFLMFYDRKKLVANSSTAYWE
jgi:hypothetical protein